MRIFLNTAVILLVFIVVLGIVRGCDYLNPRAWNIFPGAKLYSIHEDSVKLEYYDDKQWWNYPTLSKVRNRIQEYLMTHDSIDPQIISSMTELRLTKGMDKTQAEVLVGGPTKIIKTIDNREVYHYRGTRNGELPWYYGWAKLTFQDNRIIDIEIEGIKIPK